VNIVTASGQVYDGRVMPVPQNTRAAPNASNARRISAWVLGYGKVSGDAGALDRGR
jgi:hypothetical protein